MSAATVVALIAVAGSLALAASAFRASRVGARKTLVLALTWGAIFCAVALIMARLA